MHERPNSDGGHRVLEEVCAGGLHRDLLHLTLARPQLGAYACYRYRTVICTIVILGVYVYVCKSITDRLLPRTSFA